MERKVYADNAATTAMSRTAIEAMLPYLDGIYGNPSSLYSLGQRAKEALEGARADIAACLGAQANEIYFTSCGSESDNQAIRSAAHLGALKGKKHIISTAFEHHAVLHTLDRLKREEGFEVTLLDVHRGGVVRPEEVQAAIRPDTCLVTVMFANNEIGTVQPIAEIGAACRAAGVTFHTDAVQAAGHIPVNVAEQNIDMLSISAHKFHGPKGVGALYCRRGVRLLPFIDGGAQERGRRAGTENVAGIVAMAAALKEACANMQKNSQKLINLREKIIAELTKIPHSRLNGDRNTPGYVTLLAKGGEPMQAHQQLDGGAFVVESDSVCWLEDLGADDYSLPGFWDYKPGGRRWTYFRNNNFSHNTLSVDRRLQYAAGEAFVCEEKPDAKQPYARLDMTSLYKGTAQSVFRTFTLKDDRTVEVKDELKPTEGGHTVTWNAVTKARVEVKGNQAHLTRDGKHFYMEITSPAGVVFRTHEAKNTSPREYPIEGVTVIEAECPADGPEAVVTVRMSSRPFFAIDHGPYLQEVTADGATFAFSTSAPSFSCVELEEEGSGRATRHTAGKHGLRDANTTFFGIRVEGLKPNTAYRYRLHAKEMKRFRPYQVTFGDSVATPWYSFRTVNPGQKGGSLFITSDMHSRPQLLKRLLEACDYRTCTAFFYAGDMMNYMERGGEHPFTSFIDASVELFATSVPFEMVRGNHETRGDLARVFPTYFPKRDGKIYGSYMLGDVMVIMLDSGEDKADTHPVYAGLTDFDGYRTEQARWLRQQVKSKAFKKARYRIVISHFPLVMGERWREENTWHGWRDACEKFLPVLNKADIDLVVSGHTHRFYFHEPGEAGNRFPVLEQGHSCATRIDLKDGNIHLRVIDKDGKNLFEWTMDN